MAVCSHLDPDRKKAREIRNGEDQETRLVQSRAHGPQGAEGLLRLHAQVDGAQERIFWAEWAEDDAEKALAARRLGLEEEQKSATAPLTLREAVERYLRVKADKASLHEDRRHVNRARDYLGAETALAEITAGRLASWKESLQARKSPGGGRLAPATVNRALAAVRDLLRLAQQEWDVLPVVPRIRLEKEPEGRLRFLSEDEATRLMDACRKSKSPHLLRIVTLALHTGMRKEEILGLTWERVAFSRSVLTLDRTKNGRRREVPRNRAVYDALSALPGAKESGPVFAKANGRAWMQIRTAFELAYERAKVFDFQFHGPRHICASWLIMRGRSLKEIQELLGHRDFKMTLRYAHLSPDRLRDAVASLEDFSTQSAHGEVNSAPVLAKSARARSSVG